MPPRRRPGDCRWGRGERAVTAAAGAAQQLESRPRHPSHCAVTRTRSNQDPTKPDPLPGSPCRPEPPPPPAASAPGRGYRAAGPGSSWRRRDQAVASSVEVRGGGAAAAAGAREARACGPRGEGPERAGAGRAGSVVGETRSQPALRCRMAVTATVTVCDAVETRDCLGPAGN